MPITEEACSDGSKAPEFSEVVSVEHDGDSASTSSVVDDAVPQSPCLSGCLSLIRGSSLGASHRGALSHRRCYAAKPIAGASLKHLDPLEDPSTASEVWEPGDPGQYCVRSRQYMKTKVKDVCDGSFYELAAADLFSFDSKEHHIARQLRLLADPYKRSDDEMASILEFGIPLLLIINIQLPTYPASLFGGTDGPGHSLVYHFVLREGFHPLTECNTAAVGLLHRLVHNGREETGDMARSRLKLIPRVVNLEEWTANAPLSKTEAHLVHNYNMKPLLTRPQHSFHHGPSYLEVDLDVHAYGYLARRAFASFTPRLAGLVFENALLIQGNSEEELPEMLLGVARLHRIDFTRARPFSEAVAEAARGSAGGEEDGTVDSRS
ncbi:unnamed protein product [Ostreobium quekettii]|uniref:Protein ENHANCED DISEASE RESISTANCE 2 C-terminal domain-containing protein n=1 Tax=Ostreobium quekettii TaxID=121088 RepID=A0A8S1IN78_9CHLO|nr:unnamed protein product [Ostreobium quekettii]